MKSNDIPVFEPREGWRSEKPMCGGVKSHSLAEEGIPSI
jgi:hypothetical protein